MDKLDELLNGIETRQYIGHEAAVPRLVKALRFCLDHASGGAMSDQDIIEMDTMLIRILEGEDG